MATRLYLTNSTTPFTPATIRGGWESTTSAIIKYLGPAPGGTVTTRGQAETSTSSTFDVLLGRWVSDGAVAAGNLSGVMSWVIPCLASSGTPAANLRLYIHAYVTAGSTDTVRGTLLSNFVDSSQFFPTTATGLSSLDQAITTVAVSAGDRVVLEIGYRATNTTSSSRTGTMTYGGTNAVDMFQGDTAVTSFNSWVQFSDPNQVLAAKSTHPKNLCPNPAAGSGVASDWSASSTISGSATTVTGMSRSTGVKFTVNTTGFARIDTPPEPAAVGETFAFYVECSETVSTSVSVFFNFRDAGGQFLNNLSQSLTLDSTVQSAAAWNAVAPANTAFVDIDIEPATQWTAGTVISVSCVRYDWSTTQIGYADGDSQYWTWDGTSEHSTSHQSQTPVALDKASETDTARSLARVKRVALGKASETDTARGLARRKTVALGKAAETDTARTLARRKSVALGKASESDTARALTYHAVAHLGQAAETDSARALTARKVVNVGQAAELDIARGITPALALQLGQAAETDTARGLVPSKQAQLGAAAETDTAGALFPPLQPADELDTARALTPSKRAPIGTAGESDTAGALTAAHAVSLAAAAEVDTARALTASKTVDLAAAAETDTARGLSAGTVHVLGQAAELDTAAGLTPALRLGLGTASEVDSSASLTAAKHAALGQAGEVDTAGALTIEQTIVALGQAVEVDTAGQLTPSKTVALGQAGEGDTARALTAGKTGAIDTALEVDTARALAGSKAAALGQAVEVDTARGLTPAKASTLTAALELDTARALTGSKRISRVLGQARETDLAGVLTVELVIKAWPPVVGAVSVTGTATSEVSVVTAATADVAIVTVATAAVELIAVATADVTVEQLATATVTV